MTWILVAFVASMILIGAYALCSLSNAGWRRWAGPGLLGVVILASAAIMLTALGSPKPHWLAAGGEMDVIAVAYDEGTAIYIWAVPVSGGEPVSIKMPWNEEKARAVSRAQATGTGLGYGDGKNGGNDGGNEIYEKPQEPLPPKG